MSASLRTAPFSSSFETASPRPPDVQADDLARRIYEQYHAELYRSAVRACRDPGTAEDLVQEAFLRLMLEIRKDRMPDNIRAWLHRVIANLAVSLGRRASVSQRFAGSLGSHDEPPTPEAIAIDDELRAELASALQALPDRARTALLLAASGYSGAEIAAAIGRTDCATRTLMCRARLELRDRLVAAATGSRTAVGAPCIVGRRGSAGLANLVSAGAQ